MTINLLFRITSLLKFLNAKKPGDTQKNQQTMVGNNFGETYTAYTPQLIRLLTTYQKKFSEYINPSNRPVFFPTKTFYYCLL